MFDDSNPFEDSKQAPQSALKQIDGITRERNSPLVADIKASMERSPAFGEGKLSPSRIADTRCPRKVRFLLDHRIGWFGGMEWHNNYKGQVGTAIHTGIQQSLFTAALEGKGSKIISGYRCDTCDFKAVKMEVIQPGLTCKKCGGDELLRLPMEQDPTRVNLISFGLTLELTSGDLLI